MTRNKQGFCVILLLLISSIVSAQSSDPPTPSTNSPYTRYGLGQLSDQSFGNSRAMGGIGYGLRDKLQINPLNPASYTATDSLSLIFEGGVSLQNTNFTEGEVKMNAKNASFDYIAMKFRLHPRMSMSVGFLPFSTVGYSLSTSNTVPGDENTTETNSRDGSGGLSQAYGGIGFKVFDQLSVGVNMSYLFGTITHSSLTTFSSNSIDASRITNQVKVKDYKLDLGLQYTQKLGKKHEATIGAVYSLKHKLNNDAYQTKQVLYYSSGYLPRSSETDTIKNGFELPHTFGVGLTYVYDKKLTVGFDYTLQKWSEVPLFGKADQLKDRSKLSFGAEYVPNPMSRNYFNRMSYRIGAYYSDPYIKVRGEDGAKEYGVSAGFAFPVSRSLINISGQYVHVKPKVAGMIEENSLRINLGITFNERWFDKWKVQ